MFPVIGAFYLSLRAKFRLHIFLLMTSSPACRLLYRNEDCVIAHRRPHMLQLSQWPLTPRFVQSPSWLQVWLWNRLAFTLSLLFCFFSKKYLQSRCTSRFCDFDTILCLSLSLLLSVSVSLICANHINWRFQFTERSVFLMFSTAHYYIYTWNLLICVCNSFPKRNKDHYNYLKLLSVIYARQRTLSV